MGDNESKIEYGCECGCHFREGFKIPCVVIVLYKDNREIKLCSDCLVNTYDDVKIVGFLTNPYQNDPEPFRKYDYEGYHKFITIYNEMVVEEEEPKGRFERIEYHEIPTQEFIKRFYFENEKNLYNKGLKIDYQEEDKEDIKRLLKTKGIIIKKNTPS